MDDQELINEILDESRKFVSSEDEIIKLFCLIICHVTPTQCKDYLHKNYLKDKLHRMMVGTPLFLEKEARDMYVSIKISRIKKKGK